MTMEQERRNWLDVQLTSHTLKVCADMEAEDRARMLVRMVTPELVDLFMEELRHAFRQGYDAAKAVAQDWEETGDAEYDRHVHRVVRTCALPTWEELKAKRGL